jgi:hypothetical protein
MLGVRRSASHGLLCEAKCPRTRISGRDLQPIASEKTCGIGKMRPSSIASPDAERLCRELAELVSVWAKLPPEIRNAMLTLLHAAKKMEQRHVTDAA